MSPLVALYFAAADEDGTDKDGCLWAVNAARMNHQMTGSPRLYAPDEPPIRDLVDIAFEPDPTKYAQRSREFVGRSIMVATREIDPRILVQQAAFSIHADDTDLAQVSYGMMDQNNQFPSWRIGFGVPHQHKSNLREMLRMLSIIKSSLFPDLGALAEEIKLRNFK